MFFLLLFFMCYFCFFFFLLFCYLFVYFSRFCFFSYLMYFINSYLGTLFNFLYCNWSSFCNSLSSMKDCLFSSIVSFNYLISYSLEEVSRSFNHLIFSIGSSFSYFFCSWNRPFIKVCNNRCSFNINGSLFGFLASFFLLLFINFFRFFSFFCRLVSLSSLFNFLFNFCFWILIIMDWSFFNISGHF